MARVILFFIKAYQWIISPLLGNCCRFYPSCSSYAEEAIHKKGVLTGVWLSIKRVSKCHPFHPGGVDVVR